MDANPKVVIKKYYIGRARGPGESETRMSRLCLPRITVSINVPASNFKETPAFGVRIPFLGILMKMSLH